MCTYIVERAPLVGSAKGPRGWLTIDAANVTFDHPVHAPVEHALCVDFVASAGSVADRVAVELSAASARALVASILAALERGAAVGAS